MKTYINISQQYRRQPWEWQNGWDSGITGSASLAMKWYREGDIVAVQYPEGKLLVLPEQPHKRIIKRDQNWEHCRDIAHDVEAVADGEMYRCPECGEYFRVSDDRPLHLCRCGKLIDMEDDEAEQVSILDWFSDVFNIQYVVDDKNNVDGMILMVACGGPNIYVDTFRRVVRLHWWNEKAEYELLPDACEAIEEAFEEVRSC